MLLVLALALTPPQPAHAGFADPLDTPATQSPLAAGGLFNGLAQVIVQSTEDAGEIKLTATADGLAPAASVLETKPCPQRLFVP